MRHLPSMKVDTLPLAPLAGAALTVIVGTIATQFSSSTTGGALTAVFYVAAIFIFAVSSVPENVDRNDSGRIVFFDLIRTHSARAWLLLGIVVAIILNVVGCVLVYRSLQDPQVSSVTGPVLWFVSLLVLVAMSTLAPSTNDAPTAWEIGRLPTSPRLRWLCLGTITVLIVFAAAARLVGLADIPQGINADEGDRTATAISILRRYDTTSIFASGWFYISNFYFWLLAGVLKILGIGYAQARAFGAVSSLFTFCATVWIAFRHFGTRVAILTGILAAFLAVSLQFARETTEATETALLWTLSIGFLLEAVRRSRPWLWICFGLTGGLSIYFYPSGRLWAPLAAAACGYLILWTRGHRRWKILEGTALAAIAALMAVGPFFANIAITPGQLSQRAQQTSIFSGDNPTRLAYYDPHWNILRLLWAQIEQSLGIFSKVSDGGGFWPTDRPIMWGVLSFLAYLGIGWTSLSWRDPRRLLLALWFWVGFVGVIVTVETPNVQRMATAVPVLPLLCALVLENIIRRLVPLRSRLPDRFRSHLIPTATGVTIVVAAILAWQQWNFYFVEYGATYRWPQPTIQGRAVADQGSNALVISVGRESHQVNSGWVRLLAPNANRGGMESPGSMLPLAQPADRALAFMLYPTQQYYLPYLKELYPGGTVRRYQYPTEGLIVTMYRVPQLKWQARQGAFAQMRGRAPVHVATIGTVPAGISHFPVHVTWTAQLRVPQYWNYGLRVGPGAERLSIDGVTVLHPVRQVSARSVTLALARGEHFVQLDATVRSAVQPVPVQLRAEPEDGAPAPAAPTTWQTVTPAETDPVQQDRGLFAEVQGAGLPNEYRRDGTIATCCLSGDIHTSGAPYETTWTGWLTAPRTGWYRMSIFSQGVVSLQIDGRTVMRSVESVDTLTKARIRLVAGRHAIKMRYTVNGSPGGLEWTWTPPGGTEQIVPPSVLQPPAHTGVGSPVSAAALIGPGTQPADAPLDLLQ